nr:bifunctional oligoribonuclease/PAP phosphatase NrnA [Gemmatimonadota bacterium]
AQEQAACRAIGNVLEGATDVVLTTHVNPDADGLGAEAALAGWLGSRGIRTRILNADPPPRQFAFLATDEVPFGVFRSFEEDGLASVDALVVLDANSAERLGAVGTVLPRLQVPRIRIDHHVAREPSGPLDLVDPGVSSTSELVYRLLRALGAAIPPSVAVPLYAGIAFDTGFFRYANTTRETLLAAADLHGRGVGDADLFSRMFETRSVERMRLWGRALSSLAVEFDGQLVWMAVDRALLDGTGAGPEDLDGLVEQGRLVEGVLVSVLFREDGAERVKVSFRSKEGFDVNALAGRFGGGGHVNAAGATLEMPLARAVARVLEEARTALEARAAEGRSAEPNAPSGSTTDGRGTWT